MEPNSAYLVYVVAGGVDLLRHQGHQRLVLQPVVGQGVQPKLNF